MGKPNLDDYVEVADRIKLFYEKYPEGSLQTVDWQIRELEDQTFVIYHAAAYRTPTDERPAHGIAWEKVPGSTPYTEGSELMNAETAAWGRAIVAVGIPSKKVASADEVRNRSAERTDAVPADVERPNIPTIPLDRAKAILDSAVALELASLDSDGAPVLSSILTAKLTEVGVETGKLGHLNVDQAEAVEAFLANEAASKA